MHNDLFGKQPCRRRDNNILPAEYIRDNAHASGHIHKTNPFRVKREPLFFCDNDWMTVHDPLHMHQGVCPAVCLMCVLVSVSMCMLLFESMLPHRERPTQWAGFWTFHFQAWFNSQHAAALKRDRRAQQGSLYKLWRPANRTHQSREQERTEAWIICFSLTFVLCGAECHYRGQSPKDNDATEL